MVVFAGIGPTTGVLALTIFSAAVLIGNFSDYAMEHRPINWITLSKKYFPALTFKHLPVNILIATILGYVGGGGIGFLLFQQFNLLDYQAASATLLAIIVVIGSIDFNQSFCLAKNPENYNNCRSRLKSVQQCVYMNFGIFLSIHRAVKLRIEI